MLVVALLSIEQRARVQGAASDETDRPAPARPEEAAPSRSVAKSELPPSERFTFYETLGETKRPPILPEERSPKGVSPASKPSERGRTSTSSVESLHPASPVEGATQAPTMKAARPYAVQVAAFDERPSAEAMAADLKRKGYPAYVVAFQNLDRGTWYRVRVGNYPAREAAQAVADQLSRKERLKTFIAVDARP